MTTSNTMKKLALYSTTTALLVLSQTSLAHTRLQTPTINEGERVYNNVVIGHGCKNPTTGAAEINTMGSVTVFPDGSDSIVSVNGTEVATPLSEIISGGGIGKVRSTDVFDLEDQIKDTNGNVIGFWSGGGQGLTAGLLGLIPFRTNNYTFAAESCAKSVKITVSIVDICAITDINGFNDSNVMMWTPAVGSDYDGVGLDGYNSPATLTINRNLTTNPLPANCGAGDDVEVKPSAAQLNRDLPIKVNGTQVWPAQNHSH